MAITVPKKIPGPFSIFIYVVDQSCQEFETIFLQQFEYILRYNIISCSLLMFHLLDTFFHFNVQDVRAFLTCIYLLFILNF